MDTIPPPFAALLEQIEKAIEARLYYSAMTIALTIPDICASLEADPATGYWSKDYKYSGWFNTNASHLFTQLSGEDCFHMRGGVLHRGQLSHKNARFDRVVFITPGSSIRGEAVIAISEGSIIGGKTRSEATGTYPGRQPTGKVLLLEVDTFCKSMVKAARIWVRSKADDAFVQENMQNLVYYRSEGIPPLFVGFPVIT